MIPKVGFDFNRRNINGANNKKNNNKEQAYMGIPQLKLDSKIPGLSYFIPFTANKSGDNSKLGQIMFYTDTPAKNLIKTLSEEVKETGYDRITTLHVMKHGLEDVSNYIDDLNSGKKDYDVAELPAMSFYLQEAVASKIVSDPVLRKKAKPIINKYISNIDKVLEENRPDKVSKDNKINFSDDMVDSIWGIRTDDNEVVNPSYIYMGAMVSEDPITQKISRNFSLDLERAIMLDKTPMNKRVPFSDYEKKASNILKNLFLGTDMFVTYDATKETPDAFIDTVNKVFSQKSDKNTTFTLLNQYTNPQFFEYVVNSLGKDKSKQHIIAVNPMNVIVNGPQGDDIAAGQFAIPAELSNALISPPSNVKFLLYDTKNNYYAIANSAVGAMYKDFEETSIPSLSTMQMIKAFKENPELMKTIQKPFSKNAIEKVVEASAQLDGAFPTKTQNLMKKIVSYYIDKKEINDKDVTNYMKEATNLFKKNADDSSIEVVFDTGKRLNDLVGKTSTKKEAANIVKQIKSNKLGTKGVVIYSQDGSPGSGRRYTAKAIAGEAKVPYIEMNTVDFGTKDVELFGSNALSPEASIKKLFSMVSTQAEANAHKSAVLFIENFEYFSVGEMVSVYHQKAMAQLLREMEKADKAGLNILIVGSVADPRLIGQATMKSFKFVDSIEVTSPAYSKEERAKVIERTLKDAKVKLNGTPEEQQDTIEAAAQFTDGFPYIYLKNLAKKAKSVALERGHKGVSREDLIEAYLQITTGRPAVNKISNHEKLIVTSHECGHATNLEVMNNIAKTLGRPWDVPNKVNFITLDPRGLYGGAVYHGDDTNKELGFENIFSSIVCSYGGNSAENRFYGIGGSYGISADMESARNLSEVMVKVMGLGAKTGTMAISSDDDLSEKMKSTIEDDERVILNNAKIVSDLITEMYSGFNEEFTQKYSPLVGTGDCLLDGDKFRKSLKEWRASQPKAKQAQLDLCDRTILRIIDCTKKGIAVRKED